MPLRLGPAGRFARRSGLVGVLVLAALGGIQAAEAKPPPAIVLTPGNGTPGSVVSIRGSGFCETPRCSAVRVLFAGVPAADGIAVRQDGTFRGRFKVPGGGVVGATNVTAAQTRPDGYEVTAHGTFDLVFGIGEQAEVQSYVNDLLALPSGAPIPERSRRGVPLASFAPEASDAPSAASPPRDEPGSALATARRAVTRGWWLAPVALVLGGATWAALRRRRRAA